MLHTHRRVCAGSTRKGGRTHAPRLGALHETNGKCIDSARGRRHRISALRVKVSGVCAKVWCRCDRSEARRCSFDAWFDMIQCGLDPQGAPWALWGGRWRPPPRPGPPARTEGTIIHLGAHEGEQGLLTSTDARDGKTQLCLDSCQGHRHYCYHYQTAAYDSASCQARFVREKYHQNWNHLSLCFPCFGVF